MVPSQMVRKWAVSVSTSSARESPAAKASPTCSVRTASTLPASVRIRDFAPASSLPRARLAMLGPEAKASMQPCLPQPQSGPLKSMVTCPPSAAQPVRP